MTSLPDDKLYICDDTTALLVNNQGEVMNELKRELFNFFHRGS